MKEIPLTQGKAALVDDADFEELNKYKWYAHFDGRRFYANRNEQLGTNHWTKVLMHRQILGLTKGDGIYVDHVNHDGLNNCRKNLRTCTNAENTRNRRTSEHPKSSQHKGVHWAKRDKKWRAQIQINGVKLHIGDFSSEDEAAHAYNAIALQYFGEFACLNYSRNTDSHSPNLSSTCPRN
jgi:hypothetical protein